jgi:hypothetical protein
MGFQSEQKKFLQQHKTRSETYSKAAATMKKQRKKSRAANKSGLAMDKELKNMQILEEEKTKLDAFCEQSLKNVRSTSPFDRDDNRIPARARSRRFAEHRGNAESMQRGISERISPSNVKIAIIIIVDDGSRAMRFINGVGSLMRRGFVCSFHRR